MGFVRVTAGRQRVAQFTQAQATIKVARARHSVNAAERLCLYTWRVIEMALLIEMVVDLGVNANFCNVFTLRKRRMARSHRRNG